MQEQKQPSYYAVIPAKVRYSKIKANAKLLYGEITALCNEKGYCWASNEHFAKLYDVSEKQVSLWIKELVDHNFVKLEMSKSHAGTLRKIYIVEDLSFTKVRSALHQKVTSTTPKGNVQYTGGTTPKGNTNNKLNNKSNTVIKEVEDNRGKPSEAKERLRKMLLDKGILQHKTV